MKNAIKILVMLIVFGCCPDNDLPINNTLDFRVYFNERENLIEVNDIVYFNVLCDRELVSRPDICITKVNDKTITVASEEYLFTDTYIIYPPAEYTISDNIVEIIFVTDITDRVVAFDLEVIED